MKPGFVSEGQVMYRDAEVGHARLMRLEGALEDVEGFLVLAGRGEVESDTVIDAFKRCGLELPLGQRVRAAGGYRTWRPISPTLTAYPTPATPPPLRRPGFLAIAGPAKRSFFDASYAPRVFETIPIVAARALTPQKRTCPASLLSYFLRR